MRWREIGEIPRLHAAVSGETSLDHEPAARVSGLDARPVPAAADKGPRGVEEALDVCVRWHLDLEDDRVMHEAIDGLGSVRAKSSALGGE
jgi:hypothetical protein